MHIRTLFAAAASVSTLALSGQSLAAQRPALAPGAVARVDRAAEAPVRIVASYNVVGLRGNSVFPRSIIIADSAGALVGNVEMSGENRTIPMVITVIDTSLVLQGETSEGVLTLILENQNAGGISKAVNGRWTLGRSEGTLRSRTQR